MIGSILKKDLPFIGKEITDWTQFIRRGYALSFFFTLFMIQGYLTFLKMEKKDQQKKFQKN